MTQAVQRGDLFILSAPSGTGKTSVIHRAMRHRALGGVEPVFSVSHTTRQPRGGERNGSDYHFVERGVFEQMIAEERFLEWAEYTGNYYGTSYDEVEPRLAAGQDVILEIDVQGAERVKAQMPGAHAVFLMPPSYEELQRRLAGRSLDDPEAQARRLAVSLWEIRRYETYDYVIINDDLEHASNVLAAIILEKRHRSERIGGRARELVEEFGAHFESA